MMRVSVTVLLLVTSIAAGCNALRSTYRRPEVAVPSTYPHADQSAQASLLRWWQNFGDPQLNSLVDEALRQNNDLAQAVLRVRAAEMERHLAVVNPVVAANYEAARTKLLKHGFPAATSHTLSLSASYEIDLWGNLSATKDAATWEARATEQDRQSAALILIGTTVSLYYQIALLNERVTLGEQSIDYATKTLNLVRALAAAGAASRLDLSESEQNLESQQASQTEILQQRVEVRNALTVLLNGTEWPQAREPTQVPESPPPTVDAGLPASLLERRPDLRAAEQRLRETLATADATRLSYYPQLSLTGALGTVSTGLTGLLSNPTVSVVGELTAPFLQIDQAKFHSALARTQYEIAIAQFRQTLLQALYDVDTALSARTQLSEEGHLLEQSLNAEKEVEHLYEVRYRTGAVALHFWLDAQQTRRAAEISLAENRVSRLENYSTVCQALGGDPRDLVN